MKLSSLVETFSEEGGPLGSAGNFPNGPVYGPAGGLGVAYLNYVDFRFFDTDLHGLDPGNLDPFKHLSLAEGLIDDDGLVDLLGEGDIAVGTRFLNHLLAYQALKPASEYAVRKLARLAHISPGPAHRLLLLLLRFSGVINRLVHRAFPLPPLPFFGDPSVHRVDNESTRRFLGRLHQSVVLPNPPTHSQLCPRCKNTQVLYEGLSLEVKPAKLRETAESCELCMMLLEYFKRSSAIYPKVVQIFRKGSMLRIKGHEQPIFRICAGPEPTKPPTGIQIGFPLVPEAGSPVQFQLIREWLQDCDKNHSLQPFSCAASDGLLPTRLLDVGEVWNPGSIHLRCTSQGEVGKFIALSHRWGDAQRHGKFCTYNCNIDARHSLCIVQPHEGCPEKCCKQYHATADWLTEAPKMEEYYGSAYCTISATSAAGSTDGFLNPRSIKQCVKIPNASGSSLYVSEEIDDFRHDVEEGGLSERGWILQERALSQRIIHFAANQTYWECGNGIRCETLTDMKGRFLSDANFPGFIIQGSHYTRVYLLQVIFERYSGLALSNKIDRSVAILGLQTRLADILGTEANSLEQRVAKLEALAASSFEGSKHAYQDSLSSLSPTPRLSIPDSNWLTPPPSLGLQIPSSGSLKPPPIEVYSPPDDGGLGSPMPWTIPTIDVTPSSRPQSPLTPSSAGPGQRPVTPSSASSTESWSAPHSPVPSLLWPLEDSEYNQDSRSMFDFSMPVNENLDLSSQSLFQPSPQYGSRSAGQLRSKEDNAPIASLGLSPTRAYSAEPYSMVEQGSRVGSPNIDEILRTSVNRVAARPVDKLSSQSSTTTKWPAAYGAQIMSDRNHAEACATAYFNDIHPLYPFLDRTTFSRLLDAAYSTEASQRALPADITPTIATFQVYMVLAIGALVLKNQRGDSRVAKDTYYLAAMRHMDAFQMWNSISGIQCSLLLVLVCLYDGTLSAEVWTLKSNIVSSCIELGLHRLPQNTTSMNSWDILGIRVFLSAYYLDRNIGVGFDRPFSISDEDTDIDSLISFLRDHPQDQGITPPPNPSLLAVLTGVYQIITSTRRMQRILRNTSSGFSTTSLLCDPAPSAVMNWRSQTFQKLELLRGEFFQIAQQILGGETESKNKNRGILLEVTELKIQEAILSLFHPSEQTIHPLTQPEIEHGISTARLSLVAYNRLWVSRKLFICTTTAKSVYMCGEALALLCMADGSGGEGTNMIQPELGFCFDILGDFGEIQVARELLERLRRLVG
ncbi:hypothetical protein FQN54_004765 [Arachnomyces sp. PD_36]|nr:hypothetical protein FQN54_004765 [Arachnomyces sp. PD_36]